MTDADPDNPSLADVIRAGIAARLADMHVSMPGRVVSYDRVTQSADVQPLIKNRRASEGGDVVDTLPVITKVPVVFQGAGGYSWSFPVSKGDFVMLVFSEASLDRWLSGAGEIVDPVDQRRFALSDAMAIPGLRPFGAALEDEPDDAAVVRIPNGAELRIGSPDADDPVVRKSDLDAVVDGINTRFDKYDAHTHGVAGGGSTTVPVVPNLIGGIGGIGSIDTPGCSPTVKLD